MLSRASISFLNFSCFLNRISPIGIVKTPTNGYMNALKMLSYTEHYSLGQKRGSLGIGRVNLIKVLIVGFGPAGPGCVLIFSTACEH
jgi:hypothetical protein